MKRALPPILLLASFAAFAAGVAHVFDRYLERGEVYPEFSSLRADPRGTSILYESLARVSGISVRRDFGERSHLRGGRRTACLYLGCDIRDWELVEKTEADAIQKFLEGGGRLVIALRRGSPVASRRAPPGSRAERGEEGESFVSLRELWGFGLAERPARVRAPQRAAAARSAPRDLPRDVPWRGGAVLADLSDSWRVVYAVGEEPVLAERELGSGSLAVAADSWFATNEAMFEERQPALLAWLIGPSDRVVFDETHLGLLEEPGIAYLLRKYRLYGALGVALAVAALAVWRRCSSLVPPEEESEAREVAGRDSAAAFVSLLRRNVPEGDLIRVCLAEWKKTVASDEKRSALGRLRLEAVMQVEKKLAGKSVSVVEAYRALSEAARRRNLALSTAPRRGPHAADRWEAPRKAESAT